MFRPPSYYCTECQQHCRINLVCEYEVAKLTAKPYLMESGIYPFNDKCISVSDTAHSCMYPNETSVDKTPCDDIDTEEED